MRNRTWFIGLTLFVFVGCVRSIWVHENAGDGKVNRLKGIPFRTKTTSFEQTTSYEKRWKRVTLQRKTRWIYPEGSTKKVTEFLDPPRIARTGSDTLELAALRRAVAENADETTIVSAFTSLPTNDLGAIKPSLVGNNIERKEVVAHNREFFLNAPLPWFGTSSLTAELADDGTLTKAESSAETKLAEGISTLFPIKDVLSAVATKELSLEKALKGLSETLSFSPDALRLEVPPHQLVEEVVLFQLVVEDEGLIWDFRGYLKDPPSEGKLTPIPFEPETRVHLVRSLLATPPSKDAVKDEGRTVSVTGQVTLPKTSSPPK